MDAIKKRRRVSGWVGRVVISRARARVCVWGEGWHLQRVRHSDAWRVLQKHGLWQDAVHRRRRGHGLGHRHGHAAAAARVVPKHAAAGLGRGFGWQIDGEGHGGEHQQTNGSNTVACMNGYMPGHAATLPNSHETL